MLSLLLLAAAVPSVPASAALAPLTCTAAPNLHSKTLFPFEGGGFLFSGQVRADQLEGRDYVPFASFALVEEERPRELSTVLSIHPATQRRFDVTVRRLINEELRERSVIGRVPNSGSVRFELDYVPGVEIRLKVGKLAQRVPLGDLRPTAIALGCASGRFHFDQLSFTPAA